LGLGPLGGSFYLWSYALKTGNAQRIGLIAFITPLLSTLMLIAITGQRITWLLAASALLILSASVLGSKRG
jgi:drug/metabolite transporter (DMT)-like permease